LPASGLWRKRPARRRAAFLNLSRRNDSGLGPAPDLIFGIAWIAVNRQTVRRHFPTGFFHLIAPLLNDIGAAPFPAPSAPRRFAAVLQPHGIPVSCAAHQAQPPQALFRMTVKAVKIRCTDPPLCQKVSHCLFVNFDSNFLGDVTGHHSILRVQFSVLWMQFRTSAVGTLSIADALVSIRLRKDPASFGRKLPSLFTDENESIGRQPPPIEVALERAAAEGGNFPQAVGVDNHLSVAVVFFVEQADQAPGRTAVKVPPGAQVQVAVVPFDFDLKVGAHKVASTVEGFVCQRCLRCRRAPVSAYRRSIAAVCAEHLRNSAQTVDKTKASLGLRFHE
jgi:hypothetical protein